nr:two-component regulator propeller domain-containing protein [uncultured Sulfurimonas sp.]
MKKTKLCIAAIIIVVFAAAVYADGYMNIYPNGNNVREMVFQGDYAWSATIGSLVRWDKRDGSYIQYTTENGLLSNNVLDLALGGNGKLWIATMSGVNVFDGQNFTDIRTENSGLMNNTVSSIALSEDGVVWIGTSIGISKLDGDSWESYSINNMVTDQRDNGYISDIVIDHTGVVWALVYKYNTGPASNIRIYLSSFDGTTWTDHNGPDGTLKALNVNAIAVDSNNVIWAATHGDDVSGPVYTFDGEKWTDTGIGAALDIDVDEDGTVYLARGDLWKSGSDDIYITTFDGSSFSDMPMTDIIGTPVWSFSHVFVDEPGSFWFMADFGGTAKILYSYDGQNISQHSTVGPLSYMVNEMVVDDSNTKWLATTYGISKYDGLEWENIIFDPPFGYGDNYTMIMNFANNIRDIAADKDGFIWYGTIYGANKFDGTNVTLYGNDTEGIGKMDSGVRLVAVADNNDKWFVGYHSLFQYDGETWTSFPLGDFEFTDFSSMVVDKNNVVWLGVDLENGEKVKHGVISFDGKTWTSYNIDNSPVRGRHAVIAVAEDNTKWIGTSEGYYTFDGRTWTSYEDEKNASYPDGLTGEIAIDNDGIVWFMVQGCLHSFDGSSWDDHGKEFYGTASSFVIDQSDEIWIVAYSGTGYIGSFNKASIMTDVAEIDEVPNSLAITGNYPNPFNPNTTINFTMNTDGLTSISIYNIMGQKVRTLAAEFILQGVHNVVWDGRDDSGRFVSSGTYICRLKNGEQVATKRMMLLK